MDDGFEQYKPMDNHYVKAENSIDEWIPDPEYPEYLMYHDTPGGKQLVGFMYLVRTLEEEGPQFAGPLANWFPASAEGPRPTSAHQKP